MTLKIYRTLDDSNTLYNEELDETYHSRNGAFQESKHVFIEAGFNEVMKHKQFPRILEIGFGTGLNAMMTLIEGAKTGARVGYHALETVPLDKDTMFELGYHELFDSDLVPLFGDIHKAAWGQEVEITPGFSLLKHHIPLQGFKAAHSYDLVYFDAFAPEKQPELWTAELFARLYGWLNQGGLLVTYSSKGDVKRALRSAGFRVERLPGAAGKKHMVRAWKEEA